MKTIRHSRFVSALFGAGLLAIVACRVSAADPPRLFSTDFRSGAAEWTLVSGTFKAENDAYYGHALDEANKLTRAIVGETAWKDYRVTARLQLGQVANDRADYGVVARYQDLKNYYLVLYKVHSRRCTIEAKINGKLRTLAEAPCAIDPAQWHEFSFTVAGPHLTLEIDGKPVVTVDDATLANGAPGLLAYYDEIQCNRFEVAPVPTP